MPPLNTTTSVVDFLKSAGQDASFGARKKIFQAQGLDKRLGNFIGSSAQNTALLKQVQSLHGQGVTDFAKPFTPSPQNLTQTTPTPTGAQESFGTLRKVSNVQELNQLAQQGLQESDIVRQNGSIFIKGDSQFGTQSQPTPQAPQPTTPTAPAPPRNLQQQAEAAGVGNRFFEVEQQIRKGASPEQAIIDVINQFGVQAPPGTRQLGPTEFNNLVNEWRSAGLSDQDIEQNFIQRRQNPATGRDDIFLKTQAPSVQEIAAGKSGAAEAVAQTGISPQAQEFSTADFLDQLGVSFPSEEELLGDFFDSTEFKLLKDRLDLTETSAQATADATKDFLETKHERDKNALEQELSEKGLAFSGIRGTQVRALADDLASSKLEVDRKLASKLMDVDLDFKSDIINAVADLVEDASNNKKEALDQLNAAGLALVGNTLVPTLAAQKETREAATKDMLSVADAQSLGVPFGTTKSEAAALGITPAEQVGLLDILRIAGQSDDPNTTFNNLMSLTGIQTNLGNESENDTGVPTGILTESDLGNSIVTAFGSDSNPHGLDIVLDGGKGANITLPFDFEVIESGDNGGWGNQIKVRRLSDGQEIWLSHLDSIKIGSGTYLAGTSIGTQGNTGAVTDLEGNSFNPDQLKAGRGTHIDITMPKDTGGFLSPQEIASQFGFAERSMVSAPFGDKPDATILELLSDLPADQRKGINSFLSVRNLSQQLVEAVNKLPSGEGFLGRAGGIKEKALGLAGENPEVRAYQQFKEGILGTFARAISQEVGVLTDRDIKRARGLLPDVTDTTTERKLKLQQLATTLRVTRNTMLAQGIDPRLVDAGKIDEAINILESIGTSTISDQEFFDEYQRLIGQ